LWLLLSCDAEAKKKKMELLVKCDVIFGNVKTSCKMQSKQYILG